MPEDVVSENSSLSAVLFLGDVSPFGLSVARAILSSRLEVRHVFSPSATAYQRVAARVVERSRRDNMISRVRRAVARRRWPAPDTLIPEGRPIRSPTLDPGITRDELELAAASRGVRWHRVHHAGATTVSGALGDDRVDLILSAAFPLVLRPAVLAVPSIGAVNFHPALLPRCRGCHPVFWTLASGETQGGVTAHYMIEDVDAGDIVAQIPLPLSRDDDYGSLYRRTMQVSGDLVGAVESFFLSGKRRGTPQDASRATYFHEDTEADRVIRWAGQLPREIVALSRTGEAFTFARGERIRVLNAVESSPAARERRHARPGRVIAVSQEALVVAAAGGAVGVLTVGWRERRFTAGELARAFRIVRGTVLG